MMQYLVIRIEDIGAGPAPGREEAGERVPHGQELPDALHRPQLAGGEATPLH